MTQKQILEMLARRVHNRILRGGGSWNYSGNYCRSAQRDGSGPDLCNYFAGFRVALIRRHHDSKATR